VPRHRETSLLPHAARVSTPLLDAIASGSYWLPRMSWSPARPLSVAPSQGDMSNRDVYADGLLNRALDPATQPAEIQRFWRAELDLLNGIIADGMRLLDVGCGTGRHLFHLSDRLRLGVGVDYEHSYVVQAHRRAKGGPLHFITCDAAALPLGIAFDRAMCLASTWGTMSNKAGVLSEMRRLAPTQEARLLTVYSEASVPCRREWYRRLGQAVLEETQEYLATEGGFRSEHFSEARLRGLVGDCSVRPLTDIAYLVTF
jgi:SAM-dependent methyltransferase